MDFIPSAPRSNNCRHVEYLSSPMTYELPQVHKATATHEYKNVVLSETLNFKNFEIFKFRKLVWISLIWTLFLPKTIDIFRQIN